MGDGDENLGDRGANLPVLTRLFVGGVVHSLAMGHVEHLNPGLLGVKDDGTIAFCHAVPTITGSYLGDVDAAVDELRTVWSIERSAVVRLHENQMVVPGFIDTHIHAPQYVFAGTGTDLPLLDWLQKYTFPRESGFADEDYALTAYSTAIRRTARSGTTTASYYATLHLESSKILSKVVADLGQRAFVGKVNMDRNSPDFYSESTEASMRDTLAFTEHVLSLNSSLVTPVITPRFAISCTSELMKFLADLARSRNLPIQSHLSENHSEIKWISELHPECNNTNVYEEHGLLGPRTIMAHCVHLSEAERATLARTGTGVSHCPASNFGIMSGICPVKTLVEDGIKVGLGTDCAGGCSPSMLESIRQAVVASKVVSMNRGAGATPLSFLEGFHLATVGGAEVMGLSNKVGNFEAGKDFDALVVDLDGRTDEPLLVRKGGSAASPVDVFPHDTLETRFEKFINLGDDRNIREVWVKGRKLDLD